MFTSLFYSFSLLGFDWPRGSKGPTQGLKPFWNFLLLLLVAMCAFYYFNKRPGAKKNLGGWHLSNKALLTAQWKFSPPFLQGKCHQGESMYQKTEFASMSIHFIIYFLHKFHLLKIPVSRVSHLPNFQFMVHGSTYSATGKLNYGHCEKLL